MPTFTIDPPPGVAVDSFTPHLLEVVLIKADLSFTLSQVKYAETGNVFADLLPGGLAWLWKANEAATILAYLGDDREIVQHSREFVGCWKRNFLKPPSITPVKVLSKSNVDNSCIVKTLPTDIVWRLSLTPDKLIDIEAI